MIACATPPAKSTARAIEANSRTVLLIPMPPFLSEAEEEGVQTPAPLRNRHIITPPRKDASPTRRLLATLRPEGSGAQEDDNTSRRCYRVLMYGFSRCLPIP